MYHVLALSLVLLCFLHPRVLLELGTVSIFIYVTRLACLKYLAAEELEQLGTDWKLVSVAVQNYTRSTLKDWIQE